MQQLLSDSPHPSVLVISQAPSAFSFPGSRRLSQHRALFQRSTQSARGTSRLAITTWYKDLVEVCIGHCRIQEDLQCMGGLSFGAYGGSFWVKFIGYALNLFK